MRAGVWAGPAPGAAVRRPQPPRRPPRPLPRRVHCSTRTTATRAASTPLVPALSAWTPSSTGCPPASERPAPPSGRPPRVSAARGRQRQGGGGGGGCADISAQLSSWARRRQPPPGLPLLNLDHCCRHGRRMRRSRRAVLALATPLSSIHPATRRPFIGPLICRGMSAHDRMHGGPANPSCIGELLAAAWYPRCRLLATRT